MVDIKEIQVSDRFGTDSLYITFTITDTYEDLDKYIFNLFKSFNSNEGYTLIASDIKDFFYRDTAVNLYNIMLNYYYKIEIIERNNTDNKVMSGIYGEYKAQVPDNEANALIEINNIYLQNVINNPNMFLLKKKHAGQTCSCYDEVRNRAKPNGCVLCYGAKYTGGYYKPQPMKICFINAASKAKVFNPWEDGEEDSPIQAWTANYPLIQNDDILIDKNNNRYIVSGWQPSVKNYYLLRQTFQLQRLPKSNIIYKFPV